MPLDPVLCVPWVAFAMQLSWGFADIAGAWQGQYGERPDDPWRGMLWDLIVHEWFDRTIVFFILVTCVQLAMFDPYDTDPKSTHNQVNDWLDIVLMIVFTTEMIIKAIIHGAFLANPLYDVTSWTWLFCAGCGAWMSKICGQWVRFPVPPTGCPSLHFYGRKKSSH